MKVLLVAGISYLIGSFSSAYVLGQMFKKVDIRGYGSGNAGATNALRVFGKKIGGLAFILDVLKGVLAVYIGGNILGYNGELIGGLFAVVGHNWPVFLKFKGGKGIATSFGVLLSIHWPIAIISLIFFLLVVIITRYVSLGSILSAILVPILGLVTNKPFNWNFVIVTFILAMLAIYRHRSNIERLIHGKEYKIGEKTE
ncbi:glycerol-3-phosphate 1-O-acyltransferase PlsY [Clostridium sp. Cult1]|uniref:glycerol-3-phosphate 1-O-acyltransferase PlsY n=1 Tax=Clostridium sp. Cult1 TaxID=2079002 RepID=UPI001F01EEFF|nr:glycerol-3-phosphate 1-O-acyltransferase PlsY [Clostridium sp. Cult1]MCF6462724.1 acyl-phosphate glycerol 3-phosphate acyltransferase [Clostridium sp. Cult1]